LYEHYKNPLRCTFPNRVGPDTCHVIYFINEDPTLQKLITTQSIDVNTLWERLEMGTFEQKDVAMGAFRLRGEWNFTQPATRQLAQGRGSRIQVPAPLLTGLWRNGTWTPLGAGQRIQGAQVYVMMVGISTDVREIGMVDTMFVQLRRNQ
jgi:hypothetical protein